MKGSKMPIPKGWTIAQSDEPDTLRVVAPNGNGMHVPNAGSLAQRLLHNLAQDLLHEHMGEQDAAGVQQYVDALARLHDWAVAQEVNCMFSGDHPIAQAAAVLAGVTRLDEPQQEGKPK
jgi:hypothetical protein